jgi:hypothetical protein
MIKLNKISVTILAMAMLASVSACNTVTNAINTVNTAVTKYAPVVGSDLVLVGNILVSLECSPATPVIGTVATNILTIIAATSGAADAVAVVLATNTAVAAQLCPLVSAIKASVGSVPTGNPTQVIPAVISTKLAAARKQLRAAEYGETVVISNGKLPIIKTY